MMAYNLMSLFKLVVMRKYIIPTSKTISHTTHNVGSYLVKNCRDRILKMRCIWNEGHG